MADPRTATPFGDHLQNVLGQPDNMDLIRLSEGAQNTKFGPGAAQAAKAPKSYVFDRELVGFVEGAQNRKSGPEPPRPPEHRNDMFFDRELIGFAEGAQNRKSDPGGFRNLQETLGAGGGLELLFLRSVFSHVLSGVAISRGVFEHCIH